MHDRTVFTRSVICLVVLTLVSACGTARPVAIVDSRSLVSQIAVGDKVEVERTDGTVLKFKVTEVSPEGLRGREIFVPTKDIGQVQVITGMHPAGVGFLALLGATAAWMLADPDDVCGDLPAAPCDDDD
ncbi:MAG: hypothetical protein OQK99_12815 [Gammaproteobacteria bacterium]|jgi:hypothetical protein|nr:hypothetical protein [Gammaproteobacteria bacterium]